MSCFLCKKYIPYILHAHTHARTHTHTHAYAHTAYKIQIHTYFTLMFTDNAVYKVLTTSHDARLQ